MGDLKRLWMQSLMGLLGIAAFGSFLVICSETMPGEDIDGWSFAWPKFVALGVLVGCVWAIRRLDNNIKR